MKIWLPALFARSSTGRRRFRMTASQLRAELYELRDLKTDFDELGLAYVAELQLGEDRLIAAEGTDLQLDAYIEHAGRLILQVRELEAEIANRDAVTPPPMVRDTSNQEDQATTPIDVRAARQQWDADGIKVIPLAQAVPAPGHAVGCGLPDLGVHAEHCACQPVLVGGAR
jgi:hypothetical protein